MTIKSIDPSGGAAAEAFRATEERREPERVFTHQPHPAERDGQALFI